MKRDLRLKKEVLMELAEGDLGLVVAAAPPPTIPKSDCGVCAEPYLPTVLTCITCPCA